MDEKIFLLKIKELISKYADNVNNSNFSKELLKKRALNLYERVFLFNKIDRLMPKAKKAIMEHDERQRSFPFSTVWLAKGLNMAKGRMERAWFAPEGGLYVCVTIFNNLLDEYKNLYALAIPVAICEVLLELGLYPEIRWLNDVLINDKKISGILSESFVTKNLKEEYFLFGIGLNVNIKRFPNYLKNEATSLYLEKKVFVDIYKIGMHILSKIALLFSILHEWQSLKLKENNVDNLIIKKYKRFSKLENRKVFYGLDLEKSKGAIYVSRGISQSGSLILSDENGEEFLVNSGEIRFID